MGAVPIKCRMYATKKRILLLCCTLLFFYGQAFSQYEVLSPPWTGILVKDVCWAKGNVDKPGTLVDRPLKVGMLYQWNHQGWIATNPFLENDTIISVENPCPAGWRMPTVEDTAVTILRKTCPINGATRLSR